uniref:Protein kinase domain-containing protein n=1 Tax=Caenorhabditis tropicalis TaxID=1561998 RepID=A0A1I7URU7_9PELO
MSFEEMDHQVDFDDLPPIRESYFLKLDKEESKVYLANYGPLGLKVAVKMVRKSNLMSLRRLVRAYSEIQILRTIESPFIVELLAAFATSNRLFMIMEYCERGDMSSILGVDEAFPEDIGRFYLSEIVFGIRYLHTSNIMHRDLKLENIVIDGDGHLKICDFGFSKMNMLDTTRTFTLCGTVPYTAPEVCDYSGYGKLADIWSFGVMMKRMMTGQLIYPERVTMTTHKEIVSKFEDIEKEFPMPGVEIDTADLIRQCLQPEKDRLSIRGVMRHNFFSKTDWNAVASRSLPPPVLPPSTDCDYSYPTLVPLEPFNHKLIQYPANFEPQFEEHPYENFNYVNPNFGLWANPENEIDDDDDKF